MKKEIVNALRKATSDYESGRITSGQLSSQLSDIKAAIRVSSDFEPKSCPDCGKPMYRHHICDDDDL